MQTTLARRSSLSASRSRTVRVQASQKPVANGAAIAAATFAAATIAAAPAFAGVVLQQPQLKKVFQEDGKPAASAAAATKAAPAKKRAVQETSEGGISPQALSLPAALVVVGGGAFALMNLDEGFSEFMRTAAVKDSSEIGAGYETDIKVEGGPSGKAKKAAGTTKVKKAAKKAAAGGSSPFNLFGN